VNPNQQANEGPNPANQGVPNNQNQAHGQTMPHPVNPNPHGLEGIDLGALGNAFGEIDDFID